MTGLDDFDQPSPQKYNLEEPGIIKKEDLIKIGLNGKKFLKEIIEKGMVINYSSTEVRFIGDLPDFDKKWKIVREILQKYAIDDGEETKFLVTLISPLITHFRAYKENYTDEGWEDYRILDLLEKRCVAIFYGFFDSVFTKDICIKNIPNGEEIFNWLIRKKYIVNWEEVYNPKYITKSKILGVGPDGVRILSKLMKEYIVSDHSETQVMLQPDLDLNENKVRKIAPKDFDKIWAILKQVHQKSEEYFGDTLTEWHRELLIKTYPNEAGRIIEIICNNSFVLPEPKSFSEVARVLKIPEKSVKKILKSALKKIKLVNKKQKPNTPSSKLINLLKQIY
jgi:hypothetical protein